MKSFFTKNLSSKYEKLLNSPNLNFGKIIYIIKEVLKDKKVTFSDSQRVFLSLIQVEIEQFILELKELEKKFIYSFINEPNEIYFLEATEKYNEFLAHCKEKLIEFISPSQHKIFFTQIDENMNVMTKIEEFKKLAYEKNEIHFLKSLDGKIIYYCGPIETNEWDFDIVTMSPTFEKYFKDKTNKMSPGQLPDRDRHEILFLTSPFLKKDWENKQSLSIKARLLEESKKTNSDLYDDILSSLLKNILAVERQLLKNKTYSPPEYLLNLAHAYGVYIPMNQANDPIYGSYFKNFLIDDNEGSCLGYVVKWAKEIEKNQGGSSCNFLLDEQTFEGQNNMQFTSWDYYTYDPLTILYDEEFPDIMLSNIKNNDVYRMSLRSDSSGHACGIRKIPKKNSQDFQIEFFEPNYGFFLFDKQRDFSKWFLDYLIYDRIISFDPFHSMYLTPLTHLKNKCETKSCLNTMKRINAQPMALMDKILFLIGKAEKNIESDFKSINNELKRLSAELEQDLINVNNKLNNIKMNPINTEEYQLLIKKQDMLCKKQKNLLEWYHSTQYKVINKFQKDCTTILYVYVSKIDNGDEIQALRKKIFSLDTAKYFDFTSPNSNTKSCTDFLNDIFDKRLNEIEKYTIHFNK